MARIAPEKLTQKKSLGQVFLQPLWPVERMASLLTARAVRHVLEIGPGPGNLTSALLKAGFEVTAVEKDFRFAGLLAERAAGFGAAPGAVLDVVNADILHYDWEGWLAHRHGPCAVVGNIPYNISTPILLKAMGYFPRISYLLFMTQLEFAQRVAASHGTKDYGSLSVFAQLRAQISLEFKVERTLFKPVPKVDSAVFSMEPKSDPWPADILQMTERLTRSAFSQRRKMLRNSMRPYLEKAVNSGPCPVDIDRRADSLTPLEFVELAQWLGMGTVDQSSSVSP